MSIPTGLVVGLPMSRAARSFRLNHRSCTGGPRCFGMCQTGIGSVCWSSKIDSSEGQHRASPVVCSVHFVRTESDVAVMVSDIGVSPGRAYSMLAAPFYQGP